MEEQTEIELTDGGYPTESSSNSSSGESVADTGSSPLSCGLPPWFERFERESTVPAGFVWCTCDLTVEECCADICDLWMEKAKKEREDKLVMILTADYLRWSCCPPGYLPGLHIGIWDGSSGKLVAFVAAVPIRVRVMEESSRMAWIRFPAVRSDFRDRIPANIIHNELIRRIRSENIRWLVKQKRSPGPAPMAFPLWERPLNSRTLFDLGYFKNAAMTLPEIVEYYELPLSPDVRGFKVMNASHVEPLTSPLNTYLRKFKIAPEFDEDEVKHWFLPTANMLHSYVYVGSNGNITGFFSFVTLRESRKDAELTLAFSFYNFTVGMPLQQLMRDAIVIAREIHCDLFVAYDIMSFGDFLTELRFSRIGLHFRYDFYLDSIGDLTKDDIGLVLL